MRVADSLEDWDAEFGVMFRSRRRPMFARKLAFYSITVRHGLLEPWDRFLLDLAQRSPMIGAGSIRTDEDGLNELRSVFVEVAICRFVRAAADPARRPRFRPPSDVGSTIVQALLFRADDEKELTALPLRLPRDTVENLDAHIRRRADEKAREHGLDGWIKETPSITEEARSAITEALVIEWMMHRAKHDGVSVPIPSRARGRRVPRLLQATLRRSRRPTI